MVTALGYKIFLMFATINIGGMAIFSLYVMHLTDVCQLLTVSCVSLIPETMGRSLEEMDIIFGSVNAEQRLADIRKEERALDHDFHIPEAQSVRSDYAEKV